MKQKLLILLAALMAIVSALASDFSVEGVHYNFSSFNPYDVEVTSNYGDKYAGYINIPASVEYNGKSYNVTSIGANAFSDCSDLTSVSIPNSIVSIGKSTSGIVQTLHR